MSEFGGRVAVVTGAGSGIGRALAVGLVQRGARVALSDVDAHGLAETARLIGHGHRTDPLDVTDRAAVLAYAEAVVAEFGHVNQVYNNAGVAFAGDVLGSAFEDIERVVDIDFWGVVNGTKAFLPHLIASGDGHVVNISSLNGIMGQHGGLQDVTSGNEAKVARYVEAATCGGRRDPCGCRRHRESRSRCRGSSTSARCQKPPA